MDWLSLGMGLLGGAAAGSIIGGGGGVTQGSNTQTNTTQQINDPATQAMLNQLSTKAIDASNLPFVYYNQPRIAGFNPDQLGAQQGVRDFAGNPMYQDANTLGLNTLAAGSQTWPEADRAAYMNPYVEDVLSRVTDRLEQQRQMGERDIGDAAVKSGAFGGLRQGVSEAVNRSEYQNTLADTLARGYSSAYDTGLKAWQADRDAQGKVGQQLLQGTALAQTNELSRLGALEAVGQTQQGQEQAGLDVAYNNFLEARDWPRRQVELLSGAARSAPSTQTTQSTQSQQQSPPLLSQLAGLGTAGLAAYKLFSS